MRIYKEINEKLEKIYNDFKKDKDDLTGWTFKQILRQESGYGDLLRGGFIEIIFTIAYKESEIPLPLLSGLVYYGCISNQEPDESPEEEVERISFFQGFSCNKTIIVKVLEKLNLKKTLNDFFTFLLCREEEVNLKMHLSDKQIERFNQIDSKAINEILKTLNNELNEKFGEEFEKKPRIFKFK